MMPATEYWWNNLTNEQRDYIIASFLKTSPNMLLKDVVPEAFKKQMYIGWAQEPGWPSSVMRII